MKSEKRFIKTYISGAFAMAAATIFTMEAFATYPAGYYDSLEGKCGAELMAAVKAKVKNHTAISYGANTWKVFEDTDVKTVNGVEYWWDMYSNNLVRVSEGRPNSSVMNIEHSVANSWWGGTTNDAYKDICHLNPSDSEANNRKANYPLGEIATLTWNNGVTYVGKPKSGIGGGSTYVYEPADEYKGDFARVFMYMFTVYDDISWKSNTNWMYDTSSKTMFRTWARDLLLKWSSSDPVSEKERVRNDGIYKHQKNRNPFIDLPELADHIWGSKSTEPFSLSGNGGSDDPGKDPGNDPDNPDDETYMYKWLNAGDSSMDPWTIENVNLPSASSYVWSWKEYGGSHYLNASAYIGNSNYASKAYVWSPAVSLSNVTKATVSFSHAAKFQTTLKSLCKLVVRDTATGAVYEEAITSWPTAGNWNFTDSGAVDLTKYAGKNVQVGFKYESNTSGADTWEIRDFTLSLQRNTSGIDIPSYDIEDDSFLVEVWGNNILAPAGARIFDINGRECNGENLQRGLYIVVKPSFKNAVKILIK